ncbi:MAG: tRNA guanosine(34) transglycosylase Tgt [Candidatus Dadabacteria bacterium]|nr:MAG: tRNA guanosine(34) transglycosylase Tgt [Candidatus Dadabacteria bacterium]
MNIEVQDTAAAARTLRASTRSGRTLRTPCFAPVATGGALKGVLTTDLPDHAFDLLLSNTYHLLLRPGLDVIESLGGLHRILDWDGAILTDSGGFQVFSLSGTRTIDNEGVSFRNHIDGGLLRMTPESVIDAQERFGSDIAMVLDVCPALPATKAELTHAVDTSLAWARRSAAARTREDMDVFGIVQGGFDTELRQRSALATVELGFDGYAIGGLSVGETAAEMYLGIEATVPFLPEDRLRYLMGVGRPDNIVEAVSRGVDLFDCVLPTRNARNGKLLTRAGFLNIKRAEYRLDDQPVDAECTCPACTRYSRGLLRHLYKSRELNYYHLATLHNLWYMADLMRDIRAAISTGGFDDLRAEVCRRYAETEPV